MKLMVTCQTLLRFLWGNNKTDRMLIILSISLVYLSSIGSVLIPLLFKQAVDLLQKQSTSTTVLPSALLGILLLSYGLGWLLNQALDALRTFLAFGAISKILTKVLSESLSKLVSMDFKFHVNKKSGEIISIFNRMQAGLPTLIYSALIQVIPTFIEVALAVGIVIHLFDFSYGLLLLITVILYLILTIRTARKNIDYQVKCNEQENNFSGYMLDVLQHYATVKYFNNEAYEKQCLDQLLKNKEQSTVAMYRRMGVVNVLQVVIIGIGLTIVSLKSGYDVLNHRMTLGGFILLNTYVLQFSLPMSTFGYVLLNIKRSYVDMQAFLGLTESMNLSAPAMPPLVINEPDIEFKNVTYYTENQQKILDNISFCIPYGHTFAIVGKTGSGKSTIIKLLLGFIEPYNGEILIGGHNIKSIPTATLISLFGVVPQDCALFNRTVKENIAYGNLAASDNDVWRIMVQLDLQHLANDYLVGEGGGKVSGGEKQRITIARVFLKNPQICIFDEFTSALDTETETKVLNYVENLFKQQTKIIITHKISSIATANNIVCLKFGKIMPIQTLS